MLKIILLISFVVLAAFAQSFIGAYEVKSSQHFKNNNNNNNKLKSGDAWPSTVPSFNVSAFLGRWYNVYANAIVLDTFQNHSVCATATYGPVNATDGHVQVFNWERQGSLAGGVRNISGYAYQTAATKNPGQLDVVLFSTNVLPFPAPYWVFNSSATLDRRDSWIIVSDPFKLTLFILCRDITVFQETSEQKVLSIAAYRGFTGLNKPIKILQGPECYYNRPF